MNEKLMEFPNKEFYNNKLKCGKEAKNYFLKKMKIHIIIKAQYFLLILH